MTKKNESKAKAFRFTITANANSVTSATTAIDSVVTALTKIGNGVDENLKSLTVEQLKSVYMGKGEADGCAAVFKAIFESEEYSVKRFAPKIKDFAVRCGLRLNGVVPSSLKLPEGVAKEPSEEGWQAFKTWIDENVVFNPDKVETVEEKKARLQKAKDKEEKAWKGKGGETMAILSLLKLQKRISTLNPKQAKIIKLVACNYDAIARVLEEMSADKTLNRKIPEGIDFKE